jgi:uncharacterized membrane protein
MLALSEDRESLAYWERRARTLPRHAVLRRREARALAARCSERVAAAERAEYGRGVLGALLVVACEGRVPETARRTGRGVARRAGQAVALATVTCVAVLVCAVAVVVALVGSLV